MIANPGGTIAKFNRIALQAGFGETKPFIIRRGFCFKDSDEPEPFAYTVNDSDYLETWVEGLSVFHNPKAVISLPVEYLPGAAHYFMIENEIVGNVPPFHPIGSTSFVLHTVNELENNDKKAEEFISEKLSVKFREDKQEG